jgi:hypothetical protein
LIEHLRQKRDDLVREWTETALQAFPSESQQFLRTVQDRFANPVGSTIATQIGPLFDGLLDELPEDEIASHLDPVVQLSCLQEVAPSRAVSFVFQLKGIVRRVLAEKLQGRAAQEQLRAFEESVDRLAMQAFDSYTRHRQRIAELRIREARNQVATLLRMSGCGAQERPAPMPNRGGCGQ